MFVKKTHETRILYITDEKKKRTVTFGGEWSLSGSNRVSVSLRSSKGEALGVEVVFSRDFFRDGEFFLRLKRSAEDARIEAGARWTT